MGCGSLVVWGSRLMWSHLLLRPRWGEELKGKQEQAYLVRLWFCHADVFAQSVCRLQVNQQIVCNSSFSCCTLLSRAEKELITCRGKQVWCFGTEAVIVVEGHCCWSESISMSWFVTGLGWRLRLSTSPWLQCTTVHGNVLLLELPHPPLGSVFESCHAFPVYQAIYTLDDPDLQDCYWPASLCTFIWSADSSYALCFKIARFFCANRKG